VSDPRQEWHQALEPTPECISIERLGDERTAAEREHLATCPRCQAEVALFDGFRGDPVSAHELRDGEWIASELRRRAEVPSNVKAFRTRRFSGLAAAAAAVIVFGTAYWMENREPSIGTAIPTEQVYRSTRIEGLTPSGDLPEAPRTLQWTAVSGASTYTVELSSVDKTVLWSADTAGTSINLPAAAMAQFAPGKALLWKVTARRGTNILATSDIQRLRVALQSTRRSQS